MNRRAADNVLVSLETYLNPRVWNDDAAVSRITAGLTGGRLVVIRHAFVESFAERTYACLAESREWTLDENHQAGARPGDPLPFHYRHHNLYDHAGFAPDLRWCCSVFTSEPTKRFIEQLSGQPCRGRTAF